MFILWTTWGPAQPLQQPAPCPLSSWWQLFPLSILVQPQVYTHCSATTKPLVCAWHCLSWNRSVGRAQCNAKPSYGKCILCIDGTQSGVGKNMHPCFPFWYRNWRLGFKIAGKKIKITEAQNCKGTQVIIEPNPTAKAGSLQYRIMLWPFLFSTFTLPAQKWVKMKAFKSKHTQLVVMNVEAKSN